MNYLLDTNIILTYVRGNILSKNIERDLKLLSGNGNVVISVVSVGELKSIAKQNDWGKKKIERLLNLIDHFLVADINVESIIDKYAEIDAFSQGRLKNIPLKLTSRNMGKNDLWIAATASALNLELLTTDNDFNHLDKEFLTVSTIDINKYKNSND